MRRLWPGTIRGQMMAIILGAVAVVSTVGEAVESALERARGGIMDAGDYALSVSAAARIMAAEPAARSAKDVAAWNAAGIKVELLQATALHADRDPGWLGRLIRDPPDMLPDGFALVEVGGEPTLIFDLGGGDLLLFLDLPRYLLDSGGVYYISAILALVIGFSTLAVRGIAAPARHMAEALRGTDRFLASERGVPVEGPRELQAVAVALNDMRDRIRQLLESREAMLRGVSHDLRTPLTRLRLRIERIEDMDLRTSAQNDVAQIDAMIGTTLDYLRDGADVLNFERCDLGSILTTICDDFADTGGRITYEGPARIIMDADVGALTRAVSNLCDNGLKFGTSVRVDAGIAGTDVLIHVVDDGTGVPIALREKVLQPYVKLNPSRAGGGFGLGLSIAAEIVARHGGGLQLSDAQLHGLHVVVRLPCHQSGSA